MTEQQFLNSYNKLNESNQLLLNELISGLTKIKYDELASTLIFEEIEEIREKNHYTVFDICALASNINEDDTDSIDEGALQKCLWRHSIGSGQFQYILNALALNERYKQIQNDFVAQSNLNSDLKWKYSHLNESHQNLVCNIMNRILLIQDEIPELDTSLLETELPAEP